MLSIVQFNHTFITDLQNAFLNICEEQKDFKPKDKNISVKNLLLENQNEDHNGSALKLDSCQFSWNLMGNEISLHVAYLEIPKGEKRYSFKKNLLKNIILFM